MRPTLCWLAAVLCGAFAPGAAAANRTCTPEVVGTWKLVGAPEPQTTLLQLGSDGWANLLNGPADQPAERYEIVAQVRYAAVPAREPKRLEFTTRRGNDVFAAGKSSWQITAYDDTNLTTAASDEQKLWSRVSVQRYFLTLAARNATAQSPAAAVVMWTTLGPRTEVEALGMQGEGAGARFARIPEQLARDFQKESGSAASVMLRIELSEGEYLRTHRVLTSWDAVLKSGMLARNDPAAQFAEVLSATVQSANGCALRIQPSAGALGNPQQQIRELRRLNDKRHLGDKAFPFGWKPAAVG